MGSEKYIFALDFAKYLRFLEDWKTSKVVNI